MAAYDISEIEDEIATLLLTLPALGSVLKYEPKMVPKLPGATLFYSGYDQIQTEAVSFTITHKWILRIYVQLNDAERAQTEMKELIEDVLVVFKANQKINNKALRFITSGGDVGVILDRNNTLMVTEMNLTAMKEED